MAFSHDIFLSLHYTDQYTKLENNMKTPQWVKDAIFYHIYPFGLCDCPPVNQSEQPVSRLETVHDWLDHIQSLGANAIYMGPVFQSLAHGYDTTDYYEVDSRLGTNATLKRLVDDIHQRGMRIILDGVFNHVGRAFWAFEDLRTNLNNSDYIDWFADLNFTQVSPYGDPFSYQGWAGHYDLVKLNLHNSDVCQHLLKAVTLWVQQYDIDGLRLDAADKINPNFFRVLRTHTDRLKPDFWLMGEVVSDQFSWAVSTDMLHSLTNFECYKGLWSSHLDANYYEIAYSFNRLFSEGGIYEDKYLYNFADNHDVNRVASSLEKPAHLYPLYGLLFTMPGIPSIYYGSEWGIHGERTSSDDSMLRPALDIMNPPQTNSHLPDAIQRFARVRNHSPAIKYGNYTQVHIDHKQFAFSRSHGEQQIVVIVNSDDWSAEVALPNYQNHHMRDLLNNDEVFYLDHQATIPVPPNWLRILEII